MTKNATVMTKAPRRFARPTAEPTTGAPDVPTPPSTVPVTKPSKIAQVVELLGREGGATLAELVEATGWLPHTTRAALTGLRHKGHVIEKTRRSEMICYRIAEAG
jgi:hypothetical protein